MLIKDRAIDAVLPERRDEARAALSAAENFFKHADGDPNTTISFNSE